MMDEKRKIFNDIIRLIVKDSQKGLEKFYYQYGRIIRATAKALGCANDQANSVENRVLEKVWRKAETLFNIENPEGWIYVVALNSAKDELGYKWNAELNEKICRAENDLKSIEDKDSFEYLIRPLKQDDQELMILRFNGDCSFQEIADHLNKPLPTVTSAFYRALEKLKKIYKK